MTRFFYASTIAIVCCGALLTLVMAKAPPSDYKDGKIDGGPDKPHNITGPYRNIGIDEINGSTVVTIHDIPNAKEIHIGKVDGSPHLTINAKDANVTIDDKIDGDSIVDITTTGDVTVVNKIDGSTKVTIHQCRNFTVQGKVDGSAQVRYHASGSVQINQRNGSSSVNPF